MFLLAWISCQIFYIFFPANVAQFFHLTHTSSLQPLTREGNPQFVTPPPNRHHLKTSWGVVGTLIASLCK